MFMASDMYMDSKEVENFIKQTGMNPCSNAEAEKYYRYMLKIKDLGVIFELDVNTHICKDTHAIATFCHRLQGQR